MNYSRGRRERENINLILFLNSDFAPRHHSVTNCRPPLPRLLSNKPERRALLKPRLVWFILISKYKALWKMCGFFKKEKKGFAAEGATVENVLKAFSGWGEIGIKIKQIFTKGDAGA